jgi:hypothetical protein
MMSGRTSIELSVSAAATEHGSYPKCELRQAGSCADKRNSGLDRAKLPRKILNLSGKRRRLLHGSEMTTLFHLGPALNVGVGFSAIERGGTIIGPCAEFFRHPCGKTCGRIDQPNFGVYWVF